MARRTLILWFLFSFGLVLVAGVSVAYAQATPNPSAQIITPADGAQLFGTVSIIGTANDPLLQSYRLEFLPQSESNATWQPIGRPISQQVKEGVLGQWDTSTFNDGTYQLRLRVTLRNGTVLEDYVTNLKVSNRPPTALPTLPPAPTATLFPTSGPSPSPLVQQPPTQTLRPIVVPPTAVPPTSVPTVLDSQPASLSGSAIQSAMCSGVIVAFIGFGIFALYSTLRSRR